MHPFGLSYITKILDERLEKHMKPQKLVLSSYLKHTHLFSLPDKLRGLMYYNLKRVYNKVKRVSN